MKLKYWPCPQCDGWLLSQASIWESTDMGKFEAAVRYVCTTCGLVEEVTPAWRGTPPEGGFDSLRGQSNAGGRDDTNDLR